MQTTPGSTPGNSVHAGSVLKNNSKSPKATKLGGVKWTEISDVLENISSDSESELMDKNHIAEEIDPRDKGTPDDWVPRHPDLIRLTGRHPFNCEPPISMLLDQGFITPISLHYVRNHGVAPRLTWEDHKLTIKGLVDTPMTLSMHQLSTMLPTVSLPVSLVCAGNRRKEEQMIKKTIGFSWGCAAHSCSMWTGVKLCDLLEYCGVDQKKGKHVAFLGCSKENVAKGDGTYGTSIDLPTAMNEYNNVLIAFEQNGQRLHPDHGFPVRVVVPGWTGGRMVKWLEEIEVRETASENHFHYYDNRVFPSYVTPEIAESEGYYFKPEYLFNELNINSAIVYPQNGEVMSLAEAGEYAMKGYAYSGGGRKVTRVEVSFDGGYMWMACKLDYPEERYSDAPNDGKYWCWMFWELKVDKFQFLNVATTTGEIRVRAWDQTMNTQPRDITWNYMGMGNNCQFTVKVSAQQRAGSFALEFLHPTVPGPSSGGWMPPPAPVPSADTSISVKRAVSSPTLSGMTTTYTMAEVEKHDTQSSAWIVIDGGVYDCTAYLKDHPGGSESILLAAGTDATKDFYAIHSEKANSMLEEFYIGELSADDKKTAPHATHRSTSSVQIKDAVYVKPEVQVLQSIDQTENFVALHRKKWIGFELIEKTKVSHDTRLFRFKLQSPAHRLGLPVGHHMFLQATINHKMVIRAYTPVTSNDERGYFDLLVKVYFADVHPKFPEGGKISQYLNDLAIGDIVKAKGPLGHFEYNGQGEFIINGERRSAKKIGLICGGTGITPAYQVMKAIAKDTNDITEVFLIFANRTEDDILLRDELDDLAQSGNIHVWYTLDIPPAAGWSYSSGYITQEMIRDRMPAAGSDTIVGMCGPPPMINFACIPNLQKLGFEESNYFSF